jgi:glycosyltransferase involved in cell wall biosynthesis
VQQPLITIITPSFNAGGTIGETMESVLPQLSDDIDHLLIDACSTDGTLDIAKKYPHLTVLSERDRGIYDGMNKGAALAKAEWILFLQADDWLPAGTIETYRKAILEDPMTSLICGSAEAVQESQGRWSAVWSVTETSRMLLTAENIALGEPMINARLFKKRAFEELGGFSLEYTLASDRDFLLKASAAGMNQHEVDAMTYRYRWHSGSSTMTEGNALTARLSQENLAIVKAHLSKATDHSRRALRQWHDRLTVQAAMNALEEYRWADLLKCFKDGTSENRGWMTCFTAEVLRSLPGFVSRGGRTKSRILNLKERSLR